MANARSEYDAYKLTQELRSDLLAAFTKTIDLRAEKLAFEKMLSDLIAKLDENDAVREVVNNPAYSSCNLRENKQWLADIEQEALQIHESAKQKKSPLKKNRKSANSGSRRIRETVETKKKKVLDYLSKNADGERIPLRSITEALGISSSPTIWFKGVFPDDAIVDKVAKSKKDGKVLIRSKARNSQA